MTDRDIFAAAALTGLLADDGDRVDHAMTNFTSRAYEWADAMLRERERHHIPDAGKMAENATNTTMSLDTTPGECGVPGEGTVGERLVERLSITHMLLGDNEKLRAEIDHLRKLLERLA